MSIVHDRGSSGLRKKKREKPSLITILDQFEDFISSSVPILFFFLGGGGGEGGAEIFFNLSPEIAECLQIILGCTFRKQ